MTGDAGPRERRSRARRPGTGVLAGLAVLLLLGGGTAVAVGLAGQDADPPRPPVSSADPSHTPARDSATPAAPSPAETAPAAPVAPPVSISVPAIEVRSDLLTLGLNPDGTLAVPQPGPDYDTAAWFDGSPRPGEPGPAVIEGHVDSAANGPSVFYDLGRLVSGDRVEVTRADGTAVTFEVYEVRVVPKTDFPTFDVYGNTEGPELRLITCGGPFDREARSYEDNIVVFARSIA
ncbi:MAG TPA: class F sortase [Blastococcus sp.]|nr:class F sortase [Blastococcus sp.]